MKSQVIFLRAGLFLALALSFPLAAEFRLDDGSVIRGDLVSLDDSVAVVRTQNLGEIRMPRARIVSGLNDPSRDASTEGSAPRSRLRTDPAGYALFFLPTAYTPPAGTGTFRDFELFFLNFGFSPTSTTVFSAGGLFPITTEFQLLTLGVKQQLVQADGMALAVTGNGTFPIADDAEGALFNTNVVFSSRLAGDGFDDAAGFHGLVGYWKPSDAEGGFAVGAGAEFRMGMRSKFIAEFFAPFEDLNYGIINLGVRLHGDRLSADIAGIRPLEAEGSFLFFPLLVINYRF